MAYDDLPLRDPIPPSSGRARPASPVSRWVVAVAAVLAVGGGLYLWWLTRMPATPAAPAPTTATDVAVGTTRPPRQPLELPALSASDALVRELIGTLSRHPQLARLMATKQLISTVVLAVEQIGDGKTPAVPLKVLRPGLRVSILGGPGGESGRIDPASYTRWESDVAALTSVRANEAAQVYVNLKPLFDEAYAELGHANGDFDASLVRAIRMLSETPEPKDEPVLLRRPSYFEHADAALRSLRPVQKQFLLIGPERRSRLRTWFAAFAATLELKVD